MSDYCKNLSDEKLIELYNNLNLPGAWDYDNNTSYTRNYFLSELIEELKQRGIKYYE